MTPARPLVLFVLTALGCSGSGADASVDAGGGDAVADAPGMDTAADAGGADTAGACNPAAVMFPQGGTLAPGTLCDEVYACADDAAGAARIEAASPRFQCAPGAEPQSACTAFTCAYRDPGGPSTLDASEIADICALTLLAAAPPLRCVVFLNARCRPAGKPIRYQGPDSDTAVVTAAKRSDANPRRSRLSSRVK